MLKKIIRQKLASLKDEQVRAYTKIIIKGVIIGAVVHVINN